MDSSVHMQAEQGDRVQLKSITLVRPADFMKVGAEV